MAPGDERFMARALRLAANGWGRTSPNPMVGAVLVRDGRVVGRGWHHRAGQEHAEILAIREAGPLARGATIYVNLEPCSIHGRTPPCTEALIRAGISRVVVGMLDPNPKVNGGGVRKLKGAGIAVDIGVLEERCRRLNEVFDCFITHGRPFVILKAAASIDGRTATTGGESQWITGSAARREVHRLRKGVDAVLVGADTVIADDPRLTARPRPARADRPLRIVLDGRLRISAKARLFDDDTPRVIVVTAKGAPARKIRALETAGAEVLTLPDRGERRVSMNVLMKRLGRRGITSVLIEGGAETHARAFADAVVDKVVFFFAPMVIGGQLAPGMIGGEGCGKLRKAWKLDRMRTRRFGPDIMVEGYVGKG